jgi:hypothetical protein
VCVFFQLVEKEIECGVIEGETRRAVVKEMQGKMLEMERSFARRMREEVRMSF